MYVTDTQGWSKRRKLPIWDTQIPLGTYVTKLQVRQTKDRLFNTQHGRWLHIKPVFMTHYSFNSFHYYYLLNVLWIIIVLLLNSALLHLYSTFA